MTGSVGKLRAAIGLVVHFFAALLTLGSPAAQAVRSEAPLEFVALLWHDSPNDLAALAGIESALKITGRPHRLRTVRLESSREKAERELPALEDSAVDVVFALGTEAALLAKQHLRTRPVVFTAVTNPVESGVVGSWSGSGTNLTGNSNWIPATTMHRVFTQAVPGLDHLGMLRSTATGRVSAAEYAAMARHLRDSKADLILSSEIIDSPTRLRAAVDRLVKRGARAIWVPIDFTIYQRMGTVLERARRHGVPVLSSSLRGALAGAVAGLFVDYRRMGQRAAATALKIIGGRNPGRLPIEQMHGYQVVVNLVAAKQCGYELPLSLLAVADRLIDPAAGRRANPGPRERARDK